MRRIGILGGTFDPIHNGHVDVGRAAETALGLTTLLVIPSQMPPHRSQPQASSFHRFAMVALAVAEKPAWRASDIELVGPSPSFTSTTLARLRASGYDPRELYFVIGADAFIELPSWKHYPSILDDANFAVVSRPGCSIDKVRELLPALASRMRRPPLGDVDTPAIVLIEASTAEVSSTAIRERLREGRSIAGLVPPGVQQHIEQHGLYTSGAPERRDNAATSRQAAGRLHAEE